MAQTSTSTLPLFGNPIVDSLTNGTHWVLGADRSITWAVADQPGADWRWSASGAAHMRNAMSQALSAYSEVANIRFVYTGWYADATTAPADIVLSATQLPTTRYGMPATTYAWAYFPNEPMTDLQIARWFGSQAVYPNASGDVLLNFWNPEMAASNYLPGSNGFFALLHELGHALGLKHPHDDGGTGRPTFTQLGINPADNQALTIMSYDPATTLAAWLQAIGSPASAGYPQTLMPLDVIALQALYGPNLTTRSGNTLYELFNDDVIETFWDAGGVDTVSAAGSLFGWRIVAVAGEARENLVLALPHDSTALTGKFYFNIERFEGSHFADEIGGTVAANVILGLGGNDILGGGGGDDFIDGGTGVDAAVFVGTRATYTLQRADGGWIVSDRSGTDGVDTIANVERLGFTGLSVAIDTAPGERGHSVALILRAMYGPSALTNPYFVGAALSVLDAGYSFTDLVSAAIGIPDFEQQAGSRSNADFVRTVYRNVVGFAPDPGALAHFVGLLDSGQYTQTTLGVLAATVDVNALSADIIGVVQGGIGFTPF